MKKLGKKIFWGCCFFALGVIFGAVFHKVNFYCVEVVSPKTPFYGVLAQKLSDNLKERGYLTHCPTGFPKTVIHFFNTNGKNDQVKIDTGGNSKNILIHGDCLAGTDINYLQNFDVILTADEFLNGFISTFNFRTAYFPITEKYERLCRTDFDKHKVDIKTLGAWLDEIIQGVRHEKF